MVIHDLIKEGRIVSAHCQEISGDNDKKNGGGNPDPLEYTLKMFFLRFTGTQDLVYQSLRQRVVSYSLFQHGAEGSFAFQECAALCALPLMPFCVEEILVYDL